MGFRNGSWMSVFAVYPKTAGVTQLRGCTSRKNKDTGQYETDFSGYVSCIGNAVAQKALQLHPAEGKPVRIRLKETEVKMTFESGPDGKQQVKYTNFNVYDFDMGDGALNTGTPAPAPANEPHNPSYEGVSDDVNDEGLPF